jgi:hypothetical protein
LTNLEKEIYYFVGTIVAIMLSMIVVVLIVWYVQIAKWFDELMLKLFLGALGFEKPIQTGSQFLS